MRPFLTGAAQTRYPVGTCEGDTLHRSSLPHGLVCSTGTKSPAD
jgi:hypothetical protein